MSLRSVAGRALHSAAVALGRFLGAGARRLLLLPMRREVVALPPAERVGNLTIDVVDDLTRYTGLTRETVEDLIRRRHESFRSEWYLLPEETRTDGWYYLTSRTYLFANSAHSDEWRVIDRLARSLVDPARVLDFGGGSGNTAVALAALGHVVDFLELSALQKDFVRFRASRHGLSDRLRVLDGWNGLPPDAYDVISAIDVFEHLPHLHLMLEATIVPSLRPGGVLAERSPFVRDQANPMHHDEASRLDETLVQLGLTMVGEQEGMRIWARS
jgi:2-polyprenyl-3-methyl-5-hydroxy-6-metoxy-1,4-benzoquinol methylase